MIQSSAVVFFLAAAVVFSLLACSARTTERVLWGAVGCSVGLGLAVQLCGGGYYGVLTLAIFLVADLAIYLYLRTQNILPSAPPKNAKLDRIFRIFFLWLGLCAVSGAAVLLFWAQPDLPSPISGAYGTASMHEGLWSEGWLLALISFASLLGLVVGGFFLVRRDR